MSDDSIKIPIELPADTRGVKDAVAWLERLKKAEQETGAAGKQLSAEAVKIAQAEAKMAAAAARTAAEQRKAAQDILRRGESEAKAQRILAQTVIIEQRAAKEAANTAAANDRAALAAMRLAKAQEQAGVATKKTADGLAILPRSFAGLTDELQSQITSLAGWGAAFTAAGAVAQSFKDAFEFKAQLDATTRSIEAQLRGVRDSGQVFSEARAFATQYKLTQEETTDAIQSSIGVMRNSEAAVGDIISVLARLQILSPEQSLQEAAFALKALAGGDTQSLVTRFEVSRDVATEMKNEIAGGRDAVAVLNEFLNNTGITMETLQARTEGTMGAMKDLAKAQEDLKLAQAEWAEGPGLKFLEVQINATRGATRLLSGDWQGMAEGIEAGNQTIQASSAGMLAYVGVLAAGGSQTEANAASQRIYNDVLRQLQEEAAKANNSMGRAAEEGQILHSVMSSIANSSANAKGGMLEASAGANIVGNSFAKATSDGLGLLGVMNAIAGRAAATASQQAAGGFLRGAGNRAGSAAGSASTQASIRAMMNVNAAPVAVSGGGGGGGGSSAADRATREAERAADQVQSIRERQADMAEDLAEKQEAREAKHTEALAELEQDRAEKLVDIEQDAAEKLTDIQQDLADKQADIAADATKKLTDIKKKEVADLAALAAKQAADDESARRGLTNSVASAGIESRLSSSTDDFELAGSTGDERKALLEREARQKQQQEALQSAAARAQGMDPLVGQAAFEAERRGLEERAKLDEDYAARKEELEGDAAGLAELEALYTQRQAIIAEAVAQEIAEAQQEADLKRQVAEAEKAEVIQRAKDERAAVEEERRAQTAAVLRESEAQKAKVIADSEEQKAKVLADTEEQRTKIEEEYAKSGLAITKWADDAERDLQRVIDKADATTRALLAVGAPSGDTTAASADAPKRHSGGPLEMGQAYTINPNETAVFPDKGYMIPFLPPGMGAGSGPQNVSFDFSGMSFTQQPGQDLQGFANMVTAQVMARMTQAMKGRGF